MNDRNQKDLESIKAGLRQLRDEIKVHAHLATMDLKDEWVKLEPKLAEAEKYADAVSDAAVESAKALQHSALKLRDKLQALRGQHGIRTH
jgi:predicted nuclease with TOPRIM domain